MSNTTKERYWSFFFWNILKQLKKNTLLSRIWVFFMHFIKDKKSQLKGPIIFRNSLKFISEQRVCLLKNNDDVSHLSFDEWESNIILKNL